MKELENEKEYWKEQSEFRLKIILDLEKQLRDNGFEPYSETRNNSLQSLQRKIKGSENN